MVTVLLHLGHGSLQRSRPQPTQQRTTSELPGGGGRALHLRGRHLRANLPASSQPGPMIMPAAMDGMSHWRGGSRWLGRVIEKCQKCKKYKKCKKCRCGRLVVSLPTSSSLRPRTSAKLSPPSSASLLSSAPLGRGGGGTDTAAKVASSPVCLATWCAVSICHAARRAEGVLRRMRSNQKCRPLSRYCCG